MAERREIQPGSHGSDDRRDGTIMDTKIRGLPTSDCLYFFLNSLFIVVFTISNSRILGHPITLWLFNIAMENGP
jgi:hypothetical protein